MSTCTHLDQIEITQLPEPIAGCEDCLAIGGRWVHLRMCETCGKIGCCDSSPNRHASRHAREAGHPGGELLPEGFVEAEARALDVELLLVGEGALARRT